MEFGEIEPVKAGAEARHPKDDGFGEVEPVNDGFGEMEPVNDGFGEVEPVESKQDLGFWERKRLELEAKTGDKTSWGELAVNKTVGFGIDELKETVDEYSEQRLMKGEEDNPLKMVELARRIGLTQEQIDKVTARADSGKRSIGGFKLAPNADVLKQGFAELAKAKVAERVRTREAAQQRLANAEEQSTMGAIAGGVVDMASMPLKFANPATIGATTMINIGNRTGALHRDTYTLDEDGNPVLVKEGDSGALALAKGTKGGASETAAWVLLGPILRPVGKVISKIPGVGKLFDAATKGVAGAGEKLAAKLGKSEGGRLALKTVDVLGDIEDKIHLGSLPGMVAKTRLTEFLDEVVGLNAREGEREKFGEWLGKVTSVEDNVRLLTGLIGFHAITAGVGAYRAHRFNKEFRGTGREEIVGEFIGADRAKKLSNEDLEMMYRIVTSPGLTAEKAGEFLDGLKGDLKAAGEQLQGELARRREVTPEQEEKLDAKIAEYAGGNETIAEKVKADILSKMQDSRAIDMPEMLDEMVAMSAREYEPEARRMKVHDLRGSGKTEGEKLSGIEELGVTSWEAAEAEGLTEKDRFGRYGGGARRALHISIEGTEKLKAAVKAGEISGEMAEELLTAAQCELGARPAEERAALIDGIIDRAKGDEALARRMIERLEEEDRGGETQRTLDERLDRAAAEAKVDAIKERNPGASDAEARGAAVEPVETEDGRMTTLGEVVGAEGPGNGDFSRRDAESAEARGGNEKPGIGNEKPGIGNEKPGIGNAKPKTVSIAKEGIEYRDAKARLDEQKGREFSNSRTGISARLSATGARKLISDAAVAKSVANGFTRRQHNEIAANVGALFEDASLAEARPDRAGDANIKSIKRFITPIEVDGREAVAWITVKESTEHGHRIYSVEGIKLAALSPSMRRALADRNSADNAAVSKTELSSSTRDSLAKPVSGVKPQSALEGVEMAERLKGTKLKAVGGGWMTTEKFPELRVSVSSEGVEAVGLSAEMMAKPENTADVAAVLAQMTRIAKRNGVGVMFPDQASADIAKAIVREVKEQGLAKAQAKLDTRSKLFNLLFKTALGTGVTYDEAGFKEGLAKVSNGRQFIDKHGNIYGFVDGEGGIHFNPVALNFNTPIHEYGHLALEAIKGFNNKLWQRGMDLVKESDYYREIARQSEIEGHEYSYLKGKVDQICDEALATLIGDRGEKLVTEKGLEAPLKAWLKEFWKAFKGAFGLADLSDEQVERMTLAEFADAVNAELLRGSEFGIRRRPSGLNRREAAKLREKKKEDQHWADEAARAEAEERERFEKSGMSVIDYVRSRAEEGEPPFDIDWEIAREIAHDMDEGRFAVGGIFTGSAADYANRSREGGKDDGPSIKKIGSGEGSQVYGWGLYGSTVRGVAEGYAKDAREYNAEKNGKRIDLIFPKNMLEAETAKRLMENDGDVRKTIEKLKRKGIGSAIIKELEEHGAEYSVAPKHEQLYEQTFFTDRAPGDESHLLKWYEPVTSKQIEWIAKEIANYDPTINSAPFVKSGMTGEDIYINLENFGKREYGVSSQDAPKFASELLRDAGIDGVKYPVDSYGGKGVKDGDKAGWNYVSFRDDNIRVDHKWTDGVAKFSVAVRSLTDGKKNATLRDVDQKRLTAVMRGLGTGELKHPRFTTEEFAASKGTEHEQLWNYILSLESPDVDGGGAQAFNRGKRGAGAQSGDRLGRLRRVATRYGRDPKEIASGTHKYLDRGAESRVYDKGDGTVIKVRRLDAYDMDGVKHALAKIVYHNYLFPKDAYKLQEIAVWKNGRGFDEFYMILEQPLVTPKTDANGNIVEPSQGAIFEALKKTGQKFNLTGGYYDNGDTPSGSSSGDVVESAKMVAASGDYAVYDFKPGRNTFIDAETGEVRFIDPRIDINDPTDNFAYSKFGKRRRTDAWFDADAQIEAARKQAEARKDAPDGELTAEDEARIREQEEADAALDDENFDVSPSGKGEGKFAAGREDWSWLDEGIFQVKPSLATVAMGEREQKPAGLAAAVEKREALRPWTKKQSPADLAKPIAFDAADMVMFWRAVSGSLRNPHVQKGERIKGRPSAIGLNVGGDRIEIVSKLFGVIDASDIKTLREACKADGFFQNEDPDWAAKRSKASVQAEIDRSNAELDKRTRELFRKRVETGEGGEHYATEVLGHEIGHTLGLLPAGAQLGPIGNAAMTLYKAMEREWKRQISETRKVGDAAKNVKGEITRLIAWWHGQEKMPDYYRKPNEMFAELFGIFLTQPESVQAAAPHAYDACVKIIAGNDKLAAAYRKIAGLKWSGKSNDRVMDEVRKTWEKEAQDQYRKLRQMSRESVSLKRDWFSYALNDRFGPMFNIAQRGLAAEKKLLEEAVRTGAMSEAEAKDRLADKEAEINALKTSLYDWQRQSGGQTRLMIAEFDEVRDAAERDGTSWNDVRDYAHLMRVIELGGRATAHGMDPARASATLEDMQKRMGAAAFANVEKTWKAFRAVYERSVLEDANVREIFDDATMKLLYENKHYVTMKHRMGVEESAEWQRRVEEYRKGNQDAWDPCIDIQERLHRGFGSGGDGEAPFVLYRLEGSLEATEDPIAATIIRAIEIKGSAARNHLLKQMSETLRTLGAKGVYDTAIEKGAKPHSVDKNVYGKLAYMEGGVLHELIVPRVVYRSFKTENMSWGSFGAAMRFIRNTMTLWNPMFINRAYLVDKSALETNLKGMHKAPIDVLSEALCIRGIGVPLYLANNYLTRFTPIANTWVGKLLWNENTANHYARQAQKIARICYEGKFGERLSEARELREMGETGKAAEIEQNVAIAKEMLRRNVFQSAYEFNREQAGFDTDAIMQQFGYRIDGGKDPATWRGRAWAKTKAAGRWWNRFEEEQEAVTKIIAYLYEMKKGGNADAVARTVIEQGGTPNLAARGVFASYIENATGFFWNVRKEGMLRTVRALKDHPTEWICKNLAQTALPALLKGLMVTGGLEVLIRSLFDDDDEKVKRSWWAPAVIEHARFMNAAMKCVPGYYQRNYNIIPLAKFGDHVLSMRVKYSPEEFAAQNAIHTAFQMFGKDPTDPDADWSTLADGMWSEFLPDIFGRNYALDAVGTIVGPLLGKNPYDRYRQRNIYDDATWKTRWDKPGHMMQEIGKNFWNYSPLGTFTATFKNGQERRLEDTDVPAWLDRVLATPVVSRIPASMLTITSSDTYVKALGRVDQKRRAYAKLVAQDILADCIANGRLGGFDDALKDLPPELRVITIRHVINGWRQYHMDPAAKTLKRMRAIKDPHLKARARQWIEDGMKDD